MTLGDFSKQAEAYRRARPTYPAALIDQLASDAGLVRGDPVADFGAGTGIMTALLVERGFIVSAIEPNETMRNQTEGCCITAAGSNWSRGAFFAIAS